VQEDLETELMKKEVPNPASVYKVGVAIAQEDFNSFLLPANV
jgi:hypothetical protein